MDSDGPRLVPSLLPPSTLESNRLAEIACELEERYPVGSPALERLIAPSEALHANYGASDELPPRPLLRALQGGRE